MYRRCIKRVLDIVISGVALIILSPLFLVLCILIKCKLGSPVLFRQERPGRDEKIFVLYKFRSMTDERDENGKLLPDEKRLTKFGSRLRSSSLDELPEFFNILKGDMSLVGPRPLLVEYLPYYREDERARHSVRPGLTGLAQVSGRNFLSWDERFQKDIEYVNNYSFSMDFKIIVATVAAIFKKEDIAVDTNAVEGYLCDEREKRIDG